MQRAVSHAWPSHDRIFLFLALALAAVLAAGPPALAQAYGAPAPTAQMTLGCANEPGARLIGWRVHVAEDGPSGIEMICARRDSPVSWDAGSVRPGQRWYAPGSRETGWEHVCPAGEAVVGYAEWRRAPADPVITDITPVCRAATGGPVRTLAAMGVGSPRQVVLSQCVWRSEATLLLGVSTRIGTVHMACADPAPAASPGAAPRYGASATPQERPPAEAPPQAPPVGPTEPPNPESGLAHVTCGGGPGLRIAGWRMDTNPKGATIVSTICVQLLPDGRWQPGSLGLGGETWTSTRYAGGQVRTYQCPEDTVVVGFRAFHLMPDRRPGNRVIEAIPLCGAAGGTDAFPLSGEEVGFAGAFYPGEMSDGAARADVGCPTGESLRAGFLRVTYGPRLTSFWFLCGSQLTVSSPGDLDTGVGHVPGETFGGRDQVPGARPRDDRERPRVAPPAQPEPEPFRPNRRLDEVPPCPRDFENPGGPAPTPTGECIPDEDPGEDLARRRNPTATPPPGAAEVPFTPDTGRASRRPPAAPAPSPAPAAPAAPARDPLSPDVPDCPRQNGLIVVPANMGWCNSGVRLSGNNLRLTITAQGRWSNSGPPNQGPEGFAGYRHPGTVVGDADLASLVARIGGGPGFGAGARFDARNSQAGWLILSINDTPDTLGDNQGYVEVRVRERPE